MRRDWKAITWDYDWVRSLSEEECAFCLTEQETAVISAAIDYLGWPTRWHNAASGIDQDWLEAFAGRLAAKLMGCNETSNEATFRAFQDAVARNAARVQRNFEAWDGTPGSINPFAGIINNFDTGVFQSPEPENNCAASCEYVRVVVWNYYMVLVTSYLTAAAITVAVAPLGMLFWVIGALIVMVAGLGADHVSAALNDEAAMDSIGCQLATALAGQVANYINFNAAIAGLTSATDNEYTIVSILQAANQTPAGFYLYLDLWGNAEQMSMGGTLLPCCCSDPCEWDHDLTLGVPTNFEVITGHYVAGTGVVGNAVTGWGSRAFIIIRLDELCMPDYINVQGYKSGDITHDFWYALGVIQPDGSIEYQQPPTAWQGSSGAGTWSHNINVIPGVTDPFDAIYLRTEDNTEVRLTRVAAVP